MGQMRVSELDPGRRIRMGLVLTVAILLALGTVMIYSASAIYADQRLGDSMFFLKRHAIFLVVGFVLSMLVMLVDYKSCEKYAWLLMVMTFVFLILVLWMPDTVAGTRRWFRIGGYNIQPSEFAKLSTIFFIAHYLELRGGFGPKAVYLLNDGRRMPFLLSSTRLFWPLEFAHFGPDVREHRDKELKALLLQNGLIHVKWRRPPGIKQDRRLNK